MLRDILVFFPAGFGQSLACEGEQCRRGWVPGSWRISALQPAHRHSSLWRRASRRVRRVSGIFAARETASLDANRTEGRSSWTGGRYRRRSDIEVHYTAAEAAADYFLLLPPMTSYFFPIHKTNTTKFIRTSGFLCRRSDRPNVELTTETSAWSCSHRLCRWTITYDIFTVLMDAARYELFWHWCAI